MNDNGNDCRFIKDFQAFLPEIIVLPPLPRSFSLSLIYNAKKMETQSCYRELEL